MKSVLDGAQMEKFQESIKNLEVSDSLLRDWFAGQVLSTLSRNMTCPLQTSPVLKLGFWEDEGGKGWQGNDSNRNRSLAS